MRWNIFLASTGVLLLAIGGVIAWRMNRHNLSTQKTTSSAVPAAPVPATPAPTIPPVPVTPPPPVAQSAVVTPIAEFKQRITKKFFGTYVTPTNSPVQPERFMGYHTGVDVEYTDTTTDVPVHAIADGTVIISEYASGYGGVLEIKHTINGRTLYVTYGHLRQSSMVAAGAKVTQGQQIAVLGTGYSHETDGERRHLHFDVAVSPTIRGYAQTKAELNATWIDPLSLY